MNDEQLQSILQSMQAQLVSQAAELHALRANRDGTAARPLLVLGDTISAIVAPHLQLSATDAAERKRILGQYPKISEFPECIKDENGMAARAISDTEQRKWVTERLPAIQKDHLEVARVAAATWELASMCDNNEGRMQLFDRGIKDIIALSINSAQRSAEAQLKQSFKGAGADGSYSLLDLSPDTRQLDLGDTNIFQQAHLDAMAELRKFKQSIDANKKSDTQKPGGGRGGGSRGGKGGYQNTYNNNRGGYGGGKGGKGSYGGKGKGKGGKGWSGNDRQTPSPMDP